MIDTLKKEIKKLLSDKKKRINMSQKQKQYVKKYNIENYYNAFVNIIDDELMKRGQ